MEDNRRQREFLLKEYRDEGRIDDDEYDNEYDDSSYDSDSSYDDEHADDINEPDQHPAEWIKEPIGMMDPKMNQRPMSSWDEFDAKYDGRPFTAMERTEKELAMSRQEYFEELKKDAEAKKEREAANAEPKEDKPKHEIPEEWLKLSPA